MAPALAEYFRKSRLEHPLDCFFMTPPSLNVRAYIKPSSDSQKRFKIHARFPLGVEVSD
jgi:hypothetical protein